MVTSKDITYSTIYDYALGKKKYAKSIEEFAKRIYNIGEELVIVINVEYLRMR